MKEVTVDKHELLDALRENRAAHRSVFERALEGYRQRCLELLEEKLEDIKAGRTPLLMFGLPVPQDHTVDYDRVIRMVEMEIGDTVTLDERHFARYVMDDWEWKEQFTASTTAYLAT